MEATPPPQQPGGQYPPPQPGGQYGAPQQQYGQPPYPPAPAGPRGKLDTANAFERVFQLYASQFLILIGLALVIFVPIALLQGAVLASGSVGLLFVTAIIGLMAQALYTGSVVEAVADMRDGRRDFSVGTLLRRALPFMFPLVGGGLLFGLIFVIGLILIIIPGLLFLTWFCLFGPAIVVEQQGVFASFTRSRDLVRGNGWRVFGVLLVTVILVGIVGNLINRVVYGAAENFVGGLIGNLLSNLITGPVLAITVATLFFMLRDLQMGTQGFSGPAPPPRV